VFFCELEAEIIAGAIQHAPDILRAFSISDDLVSALFAGSIASTASSCCVQRCYRSERHRSLYRDLTSIALVVRFDSDWKTVAGSEPDCVTKADRARVVDDPNLPPQRGIVILLPFLAGGCSGRVSRSDRSAPKPSAP